MSEQEQTPQVCQTCGGLGAIVVTEHVVDEEGYEYDRQVQRPCPSC